jgi:hypothetical protein
MGHVFAADAAEMRAHADALDALARRFDAVKAASAHVAQNDAAYGFLCGWIARVLEGRHTRQDELFDYVQQNLVSAAANLRTLASTFDAANTRADSLIRLAAEPGAW